MLGRSAGQRAQPPPKPALPGAGAKAAWPQPGGQCPAMPLPLQHPPRASGCALPAVLLPLPVLPCSCLALEAHPRSGAPGSAWAAVGRCLTCPGAAGCVSLAVSRRGEEPALGYSTRAAWSQGAGGCGQQYRRDPPPLHGGRGVIAVGGCQGGTGHPRGAMLLVLDLRITCVSLPMHASRGRGCASVLRPRLGRAGAVPGMLARCPCHPGARGIPGAGWDRTGLGSEARLRHDEAEWDWEQRRGSEHPQGFEPSRAPHGTPVASGRRSACRTQHPQSNRGLGATAASLLSTGTCWQ